MTFTPRQSVALPLFGAASAEMLTQAVRDVRSDLRDLQDDLSNQAAPSERSEYAISFSLSGGQATTHLARNMRVSDVGTTVTCDLSPALTTYFAVVQSQAASGTTQYRLEQKGPGVIVIRAYTLTGAPINLSVGNHAIAVLVIW